VSQLAAVEAAVGADGVRVVRGGDFDRWDLEARLGLVGGARLLMAVEEHGAGRQLFRFRAWARPSGFGGGLAVAFGLLAAGAALDGVLGVAAILTGVAVFLAGWMFLDCGFALAALERGVRQSAVLPSAAAATDSLAEQGAA
jgi:hypothetical protein